MKGDTKMQLDAVFIIVYGLLLLPTYMGGCMYQFLYKAHQPTNFVFSMIVFLAFGVFYAHICHKSKIKIPL